MVLMNVFAGVRRDSDIENKDLPTRQEGEGGPNRARVTHTCAATRSRSSAGKWLRNRVLCDKLEGRGGVEGRSQEFPQEEGAYEYLPAGSHGCVAETNTTLYSKYPPIRKK